MFLNQDERVNRFQHRRLRTHALRVVLAAGIAAAAAYGVRYGVVEPPAMGEICNAPAAPIWCVLRSGLNAVTSVYALGYAALAVAAAAIVIPPRVARRLIIAAAVLGGMGLFLFNPAQSAPALLLALLRGARLDSQPVQAEQLSLEAGQPR